MKELITIQSELKAPKNQYNSFGKYNYRSAEDILEALKPLLKKNECYLTLSDEMAVISDRIYVKATATISNKDEHVSVSAFAREEDTKKGMDGAQITGSASSYARKYALNGLFCIDDTNDSDSTNTHGKDGTKAKDGDDGLKDALEGLNKCKDEASVNFVMKSHESLWTNATFKNAVAKKRKELKDVAK